MSFDVRSRSEHTAEVRISALEWSPPLTGCIDTGRGELFGERTVLESGPLLIFLPSSFIMDGTLSDKLGYLLPNVISIQGPLPTTWHQAVRLRGEEHYSCLITPQNNAGLRS